MLQALTAYILSAMLAWSPVVVHRYAQHGVPAEEADRHTMDRYQAIAADFAAVALDPEEPNLFSRDEKGRLKSAVYMAAFASYESGGFRADVDELRTLGDGGLARGLMQVHVFDFETAIVDRPGALRKGLRHLRRSLDECGNFSGYTIGKCVVDDPEGRLRERRAKKWLAEHPIP